MTFRIAWRFFRLPLVLSLLLAWGCKSEDVPPDYRDAWVGDYRLLRTCENFDAGTLTTTVNDTITGVVQKSDQLGVIFFLGRSLRVAADGHFEADPPVPGNGLFSGQFTGERDVVLDTRSSGIDAYQVCTYIGRRQ